MSDVMVNIGSIAGESGMRGYEGQIECVSIRHAIDLPVVAQGATRTEGASHHGAIELTHTIDQASPSLRLAVSAGTNLGTVTITRMRAVGGEIRPIETITLGNAYIVRVDVDTPVSSNGFPAAEPTEMFSIEYSDIQWDYKYYVDGVDGGSVQSGWSTATQTVI